MLLGICEFGLSFRAVAPLKSDGPINFTFALDGRNRLQGVGEIAWTEDDAKTGGLKFTTVSSQFKESLRAWLADDVLPKNSGREYTPATALPLDSFDKIKSSIREGKTEAIKASVPRVEENVVEAKDPEPKPSPVPQVFQKPIVPSVSERPPLATARPEPTPTAAPSGSESTFALSGFRLPSASHPPPSPEPAAIPSAPCPPEPAPTFEAIHSPIEISPPPAFVRGLPSEDSPAESPRLNRAAAAGIISLALAVILVALVLSFRREVGETLIRLGRQLAGEQQPPPASQAQNPSSSAASPVRNDPAPASLPASNPSPSSSGQLSVSTAQSQPATSPIQTPDVTPQSTPDRASTIQQIEDLPAPEGGGSGQREFDQAKTILKGIHRQRDIQMAVTLLWTGVRKGYVPAEVTLADLYARGDGVQRSCEQARVLLKAAIQKGSPEGRRRLVLLTQQGCAGS
jgi:hypothetical protein